MTARVGEFRVEDTAAEVMFEKPSVTKKSPEIKFER
jgi:hypothetical protein